MLKRLSSTLAARLMALAMLLTVAAHAALPVGAPLSGTRGSAFSAATVDVAVAPQRRTASEVAAIAPQPAVLPEIVAPVGFPGTNELGRAPFGPPDATGPPPADPLARGPAPRAPPFA